MNLDTLLAAARAVAHARVLLRAEVDAYVTTVGSAAVGTERWHALRLQGYAVDAEAAHALQALVVALSGPLD